MSKLPRFTKAEDDQLIRLRAARHTYEEIAARLDNRTATSLRSRMALLVRQQRVRLPLPFSPLA